MKTCNVCFVWLILLVIPFVGYAQCKKGDCNNGTGTMYYDSGNKYQGEFVNGKKSGQGKFIFASGAKYSGEWLNDKMHGEGKYYYKDGRKFVGTFIDGKMGEGKEYDVNGNLTTDEVDPFEDDDLGGGNDTPEPSASKEGKKEKAKPKKSGGSFLTSNNFLLNTKSLNSVYDAKWYSGLNAFGGAISASGAAPAFTNGLTISLGNDITQIGLGASLGYFVTKRVLVGSDFGISYIGIDGNGTSSVALHPFAKYYINDRWFAGGGISKVGDDYKLDIEGGYILRLSNNITLEPTVHYFLVEDSPLVVRLGLGYYL